MPRIFRLQGRQPMRARLVWIRYTTGYRSVSFPEIKIRLN